MEQIVIKNARAQSLIILSKELLAESDLHRLLVLAMDRAIELSGAERGMIILFGENGETLFEVARNLQKGDIAHPEFETSRTIIEKVKNTGTPVYLRNALDDPLLRKSNSTARLKLLSVMCLPLRHDDEIFGVVYLDNRSVRGIFEADTYAFIQEFTDFISLAAYRARERKQLHSHVHALEEELRGKYKFDAIIGHHHQIVDILRLVAQIADTDATVLIQGESGTGKELIARALHYNSRRRNQAFVPINCAALPENLLESELFGHVRGAFTGAIKDKAGWFEQANQGTIFLDEISEMTPALQTKLLRILQTGEYARVGSTELRSCNARFVAAASRSLRELMQEKKFREELYYRLSVIDLWLPPLRERKLDIPVLTQHFLKLYGARYNKAPLHLSTVVETLLAGYDFPGNVRELENMIQRAVVLAEGDTIEIRHLPASIQPPGKPPAPNGELHSFRHAKAEAVAVFEQAYLTNCLKASQGSISQAARIAGMNVKNFYTKMKHYHLTPQSFKPSN